MKRQPIGCVGCGAPPVARLTGAGMSPCPICQGCIEALARWWERLGRELPDPDPVEVSR